MVKTTLTLAALLLAGCGTASPGATRYTLTLTDHRFVEAIKANTQTFAGLQPADIAIHGHAVCGLLREGGVAAQAAALLPGDVTSVRGKLDALYFADLAAQDYCPALPTSKPEPKG